MKCRNTEAHGYITSYLLNSPFAPNRSDIASINVDCVVNEPDGLSMHADVICDGIDFSKMRSEDLQLQRLFVDEARLQIKKQQTTDDDLCKKLGEEINDIKWDKKSLATHMEDVALIAYFIEILQFSSSAERELAIQDLKHQLALSCEYISEVARNKYREARDAFNRLKNQETQKAYAAALDNWDLTITGTEHLWRELSHMFVSDTARYSLYPSLAAQHLCDGFPIELMDGDAAMVNMIWIKAILNNLGVNLPKAKVFVLSIMGVQSSGKSTLLNYMFGVKLPTCVSRTTRGVNMQLLKCDGRSEYDYILLLDTEGIRSPEHLGMKDSVWRDNRMATLAILPADATIILTKGESIVTISEILPIVLSVFLDSVLAENITGQMASKFYFVFNQIDLSQKTNMETIVHTLLENLRVNAKKIEAIRAHKISSTEEPEPDQDPEVELSTKYFHNFHVDINDEKTSDVRFLGTIKGSSEPPNDIPHSNYGKRLLEFFDYIHQRATQSSDFTWKARTIDQLTKYLELVWDCINKSDFQLNFIAAHERLMYEMLMKAMTSYKQELANVYSQSFDQVLQTICEDETLRVDLNDNSKKYELKLKSQVRVAVEDLNKQAREFLDDPRFATWQQDQLIKWENYLQTLEAHSCRLVQDKVDQVFRYEAIVNKYKAELQTELTEEFSRGKFDVDGSFRHIFYRFVNMIAKMHPLLSNEVLELFDKAFFDEDITPAHEVQMIRKGRPKDKRRNVISTLMSSLGMSSNQFTVKEVEEMVRDYVQACLINVDRYTNDIVMDCCLKTRSMLSHEKVPNTLMEIAIYTLYVTLKGQLLNIQMKWDNKNSISAKFMKYEGTMKTFAINLSLGHKAADLLIITLVNWLDKNLINAIEEQIESDVADFLRCQRWVSYPEAMQALIDKDLLDDIKQRNIPRVLENVQNPVQHTKFILRRIIKDKIGQVAANAAQIVVNSVKSSINIAADSASLKESNRSENFITTLKSELQKSLKKSGTSAMVLDMPIAQNDAMNCDKQGPTIFTTNEKLNVRNSILERVDELKAKLASFDFKSDIVADVILAKMREVSFGADDGIKPRCGKPCPRCLCPCTKNFGHESNSDPNEMRHDTYHQPYGMAGGIWVRSNELCEMSCPTSVVNDIFMVFKDGNRPYKEFDQVYPAWALPTIQRPLPLREYIFARYQDQLVEKYDRKKCSKVPPEFLSHDLEVIERDILNLLS
ncbi:hypothetical protein THRCLA_11062 [Thraustotheca clavata]|uniref:VLIG-type G domain-containing protein n=1 Tax=Thraustotheca clavata TaxID=74557 RepID=A0A1V9Y8Y6_9STRA|nr:hypothetical protein THRCLA_11062 [Thraustotheca clavata]